MSSDTGTYTSGWAWCEDATEEQMDDPKNKGAIDRFYQELRSIYDSIPDPADRSERSEFWAEAEWENAMDRANGDREKAKEEIAKAKKERSKEIQGKWGAIEALEEMMSARGARLKRPYEHHNEHEGYYRYMEEGRYASDPRDYD